MDNDKVVLEEMQKKKLVISGKEFLVGKLSLYQLTKVVQFCAKVSNLFSDIVKKFKGQDKASTNDEDAMAIVSTFNDDQLVDFVSILLSKVDSEGNVILPDRNFVKHSIGAEDVSEIILAVAEHNNIAKIVKNAKGAAKIYQEQKKALTE